MIGVMLENFNLDILGIFLICCSLGFVSSMLNLPLIVALHSMLVVLVKLIVYLTNLGERRKELPYLGFVNSISIYD